MTNHSEVIIIGAGAMGMAAGYYLAKKGVDVLLIDANDPPHTFGSHHGDSRTIRHAYGEGEQYVPLALRAQELWNELEEESGQVLFAQTGVLSVGPPGSSFIENSKASARKHHLSIQTMSGEEINKKWPGLSVPASSIGLLETTSGVLFNEKCVQVYRTLAQAEGAKLKVNTRVKEVKLYGDSVEVITDENVYTADKLVVTAGAWTTKLIKDIPLPLQPVRKVIAWFESEETLYGSHNFPAFGIDTGEQFFYGTPSFDGRGVKVGRHDGGENADPDTIDRFFGAASADEEELTSFMRTYFPAGIGEITRGAVCMYTNTPDEHFIVDHHPEHPHVVIAAGFSGHGFKFSSVIGEVLSEIMINGQTKHDVSLFSLSRVRTSS